MNFDFDRRDLEDSINALLRLRDNYPARWKREVASVESKDDHGNTFRIIHIPAEVV